MRSPHQNWSKIDAMSDKDIAGQIAGNPDAASDMAPEIDVRAIPCACAAGMTQAEFAAAYQFSIPTAKEWERGASSPVPTDLASRRNCSSPYSFG